MDDLNGFYYDKIGSANKNDKKKLEAHDKAIKSQSCMYCGFKGMCDKYQSYDRIKIYIPIGIDFEMMAKDCGKFEHHLEDKFN